ncbi:MAG: SpoIIE family protein phosphatase [Bacteroidales bacterium]|nr:SpoIIE family protein phosphatase [Bacteroidales bacterium]
MIKKVVNTFLLLSFCINVLSQSYSFTNYSVNEGLPNASVNVIYQDSRGFIWIGTGGGGLSRFDGYEFRNYSIMDGLPGTNIQSIVEDANGDIWLATNKGLYTFNSIKFNVSPYNTDLGKSITKLYADSNFIFILTENNGIFYLENKKYVNNEVPQLNSLFAETKRGFTDIAKDVYGRFWVCSDTGVYIYNVLSDELTYPDRLNSSLFNNKVTTIKPVEDNKMWCGSAENGVFMIAYDSVGSNVVRSYNSYFDKIDDNIITSCIDNSGNPWMGTDDAGIVYFNYPFIQKLTVENGLASNQISSVMEDFEGNIWIATKDNGIQLFNGWHFVHYGKESDLGDNSIDFITQDNNGFYWCAGINGLMRVRRRLDQIRVSNVLLPDSLSMARVTKVVFRDNNEIVMGTTNFGMLTIKGNEINAFNKSNGLISNHITHVLEDDTTGRFWIGTSSGFYHIDNDSILYNSSIENGFDGMVNDMIRDRTGTLWIASSSALIKLNENGYVAYREWDGLLHTHVNTIIEDKRGNIIVGTLVGGLYLVRSELKDGEEKTIIEHLSTDKGLSSNNIYALSFFNDSVLIAGSDKGFDLVQITPDSSRYIAFINNYNESDGLYNKSVNLNAIYVDEEDDIWFGTQSGLTVFDKDRERDVVAKPEVYITDLKVKNEPVNWKARRFLPPLWFDMPQGLRLRYKENYIKFSTVGLYHSEDIYYQFYMDGLDMDWSEKSTQQIKEYSKLNPGQYTFNLRAVSATGVSSEVAQLAFEIKPPFWKQVWFIVLMILGFLGITYFYIKYRERALKREKEILEQTVKERTKEIRKQKTEIENQKKELTDSIKYAKRIQDAVISKPEEINDFFDDHFIIFLPRDIVSGDFYWFGKVKQYVIFAVADCTGHGVPGAFMSMLGIRLLNEIVLERKVTDPGEILNQLRDSVIHALQQKGEAYEAKDGMDIALCTYDTERGVFYFSGAYNPLWIIRDKELMIFKGNRMPVAIYERMNDFTVHEIECKKGDCVYLFSDGFIDQFGSKDLAKYKSKRLKEILAKIHHLPMDEQKELLLEDFNTWKANVNQIDDVSLIGFKV